MASTPLLEILTRLSPEAWDAVVPKHRARGVTARDAVAGVTDTVDAVSLNPQPLPPKEQFVVASANLAHDIGRIAVEKDLTGGGGAALVSEIVDDWCGTGWPRRWPFPFPFPGPDPRDGLDLAAGQLAGAVVLAGLGRRMPDADLGAAFTEGADRLAEAAMQG